MSNVMNLTAHLSSLGKELVIAQHELAEKNVTCNHIDESDDNYEEYFQILENEIMELEDKISDIQDEIADCEEELDELTNQQSYTDEQDW